jgi:hypothetical protein
MTGLLAGHLPACETNGSVFNGIGRFVAFLPFFI